MRRSRWNDALPLAAALAVGIAVPALIYYLARPLALLVLAFTIAQALSPVVDRLESRLPRALAATLLYVSIVGAILLLLSSVIPTFLQETRQLVARGPELLDHLQERLGRQLPISGTAVRDALISVLQNFENTLLKLPMQAIGVLFDALVVTFLSLYLLIAGPGLKRFALSLAPLRVRPRTSRVLARMGHAMGGYVRGAAISGALVALLTWVALAIVGLEYRRVLAALAFFGEFVHYLGPMLAAAPALMLAMSESTRTTIAVALVYLGLQQVESYIIAPNVMKTQTQVPPALVIFALLAGFSIGGLVGALAALPLFAAARVLLLAVTPAIRQRSFGSALSRSRNSSGVARTADRQLR